MWRELWYDVRYRVRTLMRRTVAERDLEAELEDHIARAAQALERSGLSPADARRQALVSFGGLEATRERTREAWGTILVDAVVQDVRYALRGLTARPAFSLGITLTLALGIGANAAMLGMVDRLLFRPPPYLKDVDLVHRVYFSRLSRGTESFQRGTSIGRLLDIERGTSAFSSIAAVATQRRAVGEGTATRDVPVTGASAALFDLFDVQPVMGRLFDASEDRLPRGSAVAVLGYGYWTAALGGRTDVIGQVLRIGGTPFTIIGVAPKDFVGVEEQSAPAAFVPFAAFVWDARPEDHTTDYHWQFLEILARRRPDVTIQAAAADLSAAIERSWIAEGRSDADRTAARPRGVLGPIQTDRGPMARPEARVAIWVGGVATIVFLIACANVTNLLLVRTVARRREIAMRLALGATFGRLTRQLWVETALLAMAGAIGSILVATGVARFVSARFLLPDAPAVMPLDARTIAITLFTTIIAALAVSAAPAAQTRRTDLSQPLGGGGRTIDSGSPRTRTSLLAAQVSLSVLLLIGAGLFVRSLQQARDVHLGYDVDPIVVVSEQRRGDQRSPGAAWIGVERRLVETAAHLPGVVAASPVTSVPFWGFEGRPLSTDQTSEDEVDALGTFYLQASTTDYFRTVGTRLIRGRGFARSDTGAAPPVAVVSSGMARALWPGRDAIGQCLYIHVGSARPACRMVVGVAEDVRAETLEGPREFMYYVPLDQYPGPTGMLLVRVAGHGADFVESVRRGLQRVMPADAYVSVLSFDEMLAAPMRSWQLGATMFVAFGLLALMVAAVGVYSVVAYGIAQRTREMAVRAALGATPADVLRLILAGGLRPVAMSIALGCVTAAVAARLAASMLFRVSPGDPVVYVTVGAVTLLVATVSMYVPARGAAKRGPNEVLRAD
jgi:putative ABC transport system permease protein